MTTAQLSRRQLEVINRNSLRYPLHIAEKDYFLARVTRLLSTSDLASQLVFKGGTAIHHCYLPQLRFSEDLDYTSLDHNLTIAQLSSVLVTDNSLKLVKQFVSPHTIKIEKLQYTGPLIQPNSLKLEIDITQNVLLPTQLMSYINNWGLDIAVRTMDKREICAEKIRATSGRARYRDFFDLYLLINQFSLDIDEIITYVRQKEIREPITTTSISHNWDIVSKQASNKVSQIHYSQTIDNRELDQFVESLSFQDII